MYTDFFSFFENQTFSNALHSPPSVVRVKNNYCNNIVLRHVLYFWSYKSHVLNESQLKRILDRIEKYFY